MMETESITLTNNLSKDKAHIWHPFTPLIGSGDPLVIQSAKGVYLHTEDGRKIIDAVSSWWVNTHGHSNEHIAEALSKQARELEHVIFAGFTHPPAIQLAENLLKILPENQSKFFFSDNGSTSVEVALKMAIQYWHNQGIKKEKVIAFEGGYHGDTFGAMSVGGRSSFFQAFDPYLFDVAFIPFPEKGKEEKTIDALKTLLKSEDVAAFIFEPLLQGSAGMRMYSPEVLDELIYLAQQKDVICIADEVLTGFGRTGKYFANDYLKNKADIFCLSKGLTGGTMALGVTSCSEKIIDAFREEDPKKTFFHSHSFTANPLACAAANASFEILTSETCQNNIQRVEKRHLGIKKKLEHHPKLKDIRVCGTVIAFEILTEEETSYFNKSRNAIYNFFLEKDILLRPLGNVIYILAPYIITNEELDRIYSSIEELLESI
ncbi:adenosylmethionine--8-amino-7-oxononanoate transaminase [Xanthovirga aplysinae]|uniref:adenosylmethionine--8-amino-7-oxononanoate transaminase n=1 Tax=Xanthovirga aplysinae TaxID=2529853 RepID=UPI0012BC5887|nr:adenosylmethionine--8-amino-7-oxononanoate transaminase [Xanthovirga aplysinae]MTI31012.1 adenosylmethionine--8-amino-7-oxononanoate transaminase [Xanthovirga aplysinae]